ncbi:hypothetical protein FRC03_010550 [Tulasnella sp. 419]|nr:hypothetical protein FRC03_010550 [Tulasnella sp. 419]
MLEKYDQIAKCDLESMACGKMGAGRRTCPIDIRVAGSSLRTPGTSSTPSLSTSLTPHTPNTHSPTTTKPNLTILVPLGSAILVA